MKRKGENDTGAKECKGVKWHGREMNKETHMEGAALTRQSAGWVSGRHPFCQLFLLLWWRGIEFITSSFPPPHFHVSLWGWERWAICYKCMMNFIKYSQLLLKSLEICKIEPNMPRTDLTHRAEMWNLPEIKSSAGIQVLYESSVFFFSLRRTWFYWNDDSYMFY